MTDETSQTRFFPKNSMQRRVPGLRDAAPPSEVKVFKLNPDGSETFLRTEPPYPANKKYRWNNDGKYEVEENEQ